MPIPDHADVIATGVFSIIETSSSLEAAQLPATEYIRDELADAARRVLSDCSIAGSST